MQIASWKTSISYQAGQNESKQCNATGLAVVKGVISSLKFLKSAKK